MTETIHYSAYRLRLERIRLNKRIRYCDKKIREWTKSRNLASDNLGVFMMRFPQAFKEQHGKKTKETV
jgi:hypothetical protein